MKKILSLAAAALFFASSHAQIGLSPSLTLTDAQGIGVNVLACGMYQCNSNTFNSGSTYTFPSGTSNYTSMSFSWTPLTTTFTWEVPTSDFDGTSDGTTKTYIQPYAQLSVTKLGHFSYSFQVIGLWN